MSGFSLAAGQLPATSTNDNAIAGNVGEYFENTLSPGSAVAVSTATGKTIVSIPLTSGDWEVDAILGYTPAATTNVSQLAASLSLVTNTLDTTVGRVVAPPMASFAASGGNSYHCTIPNYRFSLSAPTTIYLIAFSQFTVSTNAAFGIIRARRPR